MCTWPFLWRLEVQNKNGGHFVGTQILRFSYFKNRCLYHYESQHANATIYSIHGIWFSEKSDHRQQNGGHFTNFLRYLNEFSDFHDTWYSGVTECFHTYFEVSKQLDGENILYRQFSPCTYSLIIISNSQPKPVNLHDLWYAERW